jgi:hypothetical protein
VFLSSLTLLPDTGSFIQRKVKEKTARGRIQVAYIQAIAFESPESWTKLTETVDYYTTKQEHEVRPP